MITDLRFNLAARRLGASFAIATLLAVPATGLGLWSSPAAAAASARPPRPAPQPEVLGARVELSGTLRWTAASGDTGPVSATLDGGNNNVQALYGFSWWESSDSPCKWRAFTRHLNQSSSNFKSDETEHCYREPRGEKTARRGGANEYITAIQVCTNNKKNSIKEKVKGVRVWGRTVDTDTGELGRENGPHEVKRTNCSQWRQKVSCPSGTIAASLRVHGIEVDFTNVHGEDHWRTQGLSLGCRAVRVR